MTENQVLIISNPDDEHTKVVYQKIGKYGGKALLFYPETLGTTAALSMDYQGENADPTFTIKTERGQFDLREFRSVWYRRPRSVSLAAYTMDSKGLDFARDEWRTFLHNTYALVDEPLWVSRPLVLEQAANKLLQLTLAKELGLQIPSTLVTNDPANAQEFITKSKGRVVVKPTGQGWVYDEQRRATTFVLTNRLSPTDLERLHEVKIAPVTFQEEIQKAFEVRVNIVGQECLAIRIDSQKSEISKVDWRRYDVQNTPYLSFQLPDIIETKCLALCKKMRLEFGAIDLICKPDGEYVFLEVNGNGQFLWAENLSGVHVSDALARLLTGISPRLQDAEINVKGDGKRNGTQDSHTRTLPFQI